MSADNGIYILKTKRTMTEYEKGCWKQGPEHFVYRVAHVQAIDNFNDFKINKPYNLGAYMVDVWGKSKLYTSETIALREAAALYESIDFVEYGVSIIDASDMVFYGDI